METKEFEFKGFKISGFIALFLILAIIVADVVILTHASGMAKPDLVVGLTIPISFLLIIFLALVSATSSASRRSSRLRRAA